MNTKTILIGLGVGVGIYLLWNKYGKKSTEATTRPAEKTSSASGAPCSCTYMKNGIEMQYDGNCPGPCGTSARR